MHKVLTSNLQKCKRYFYRFRSIQMKGRVIEIHYQKQHIMNCTYHIRNPITFVCIAPHKCQCQRKLCAQCLYNHQVDIKNTIPIELFEEMAIKKLKDSKLEETSELTKYKMTFKSLLSKAESIMKEIWEELSQSIKQVYDWIELENQSFANLIKKSTNLAESSYTDLQLLVNIVVGTNLSDWIAQKNTYMKDLEETKNWWDHHIKGFIEKSKEGIQKSQTLINKIQTYVEEECEVYQMKENLFEILTSIQDIDESIYKKILEIIKQEQISDILKFLSKTNDQHFYDSFKNINENRKDVRQKIKKITNVLRNCQYHQFHKVDYSLEIHKNERQDIIKSIAQNKGIIEFLKFLVQLTSIDGKFIQCGSNALNFLVGMKVNIRNQAFENIKIQNTSLIGGSFARCNLSGSKFNNVDISGVNLNFAQLFNCQWKNLKIDEIPALDGHSSSVWSVSISPDGNKLASGGGSIYYGGDCSIRLWEIKTGQLIAKLDGHSKIVYSVCFSPDGTTLASGSRDKSIILWDIKTGQQKVKLDGHSNYVMSVCFSPDGNTLASGSLDKSICLWDVNTGQQKAKFDGHANTVYSVCFSPDGNTLASGSRDQSIRLWDVITGQQKLELEGHDGTVTSVCFSPDGKTLASGSYDKFIILWDVITGQQKAKLEGHTNDIYSVYFSSDGNTLASGSEDNSIRLWDIQIGRQKAKLDGHDNCINQVCISPEGNTLISGSNDNSIRIWEINTGQQILELEGHDGTAKSVCFSPDGNTLAYGSGDSCIRLWDVKTGQEIKSSDKNYKDILAQFKMPLQSSSLLSNVEPDRTILRICQNPQLEARGTLILQGEFMNHQGKDLKPLFKSKGSCFLEDLKQK
ncbi:unnamed protein product [Paramecium primaurelia]|uniref:WD-40 repeat protein n=1 Tax=Paramecium primaurelia TaxID=5886 RepID=A0A8S1PEN1_PARPR|nr:unnamed protein product [Paramecium primaurelia]